MICSRRHFLAAPAVAALMPRLSAPLSAMDPARIRLGVTTDEIDEDALTAVRFLREFNLRWAEVRSVWGQYNTAQPEEKIRELRALFDEHGIRTSILGTAFFKIDLPPDTPEGRGIIEKQYSLLEGAMGRAKILGTDKLRIFAFTYKDGTEPDASACPRIFELLGEAARRAKARGMRLAIENVGSSYVSTGAEAARLLAAVKDSNIGLTWDPNNAGMSGEKSFPDGFRKLDPSRILHVHLRDYRHNAAGKVEWCAVGDGEFDNLGQIRALLKAGYQESFTLETHYRSPQGKAHASRTSLGGLLKVIAEV